MILAQYVLIHDIKKQLYKTNRVCRRFGTSHPQCKEEHKVLDYMTERYWDQLNVLRKEFTVGSDSEKEKQVRDD